MRFFLYHCQHGNRSLSLHPQPDIDLCKIIYLHILEMMTFISQHPFIACTVLSRGNVLCAVYFYW